MDSYIFVILLGLLALGHSTPLILEVHHLTSLTTKAPGEETSVDVVVDNSPTAGEEVRADSEEHFTAEEEQDSSAGRVQRHIDISTTAPPQPEDKSTAATAVPLMTEDGSGMEDTTTTTTTSATTFLYMNTEGSGVSEEDTETTTTFSTPTSTLLIMGETGSGDFEETTTAFPTTSTTATTEETTAAILPPSEDKTTTTTEISHIGHDVEETTTTTAAPFVEEEFIKKGRGIVMKFSPNDMSTEMAVSPMTLKDPQPLENPTEMPKGHVTPDWVIIVGFLVGVAVLVLLCVAIATRDKWNRPNQFNNTIDNAPADQQTAPELEKFIYNEQPPKENGKSEEYTVIPLEELPHSYSS